MTNDSPSTLLPSETQEQLDELIVYHWTNPETYGETAYLATNADRSVFLTIGKRSVCCEFEFPDEAELLVTQDYAPTGEHLHLNIKRVRELGSQVFPDGGLMRAIVDFAEDLTIHEVALSYWAQEMADDGPEYIVRAPGEYQQWHRECDHYTIVSREEVAMLDAICTTFGALSGAFAHLLTAPETPRFHRRGVGLSEPLPLPHLAGQREADEQT